MLHVVHEINSKKMLTQKAFFNLSDLSIFKNFIIIDQNFLSAVKLPDCRKRRFFLQGN